MGIARERPHVARACFVIDDARGHEQRSLECGVIHHVEDGGDQCQSTVHPQQQGNESQVADRRVRQHCLEIALEERCNGS
jgi:hypothetical protein